MTRNYSFPRKQQGMTLIELIIAIVIGLVLLGVAVAAISSAMSKSDISSDANGMAGLIANTKTLRAGGSYGTSGTSLNAALIALKAVPGTLNVSGNAISNTWGGAITVTSTGTGYTVATAGIPSDACIEHAIKLSKTMLSTAINGGTAITGQVSAAAATTGCNASGNANSLTWTSAN